MTEVIAFTTKGIISVAKGNASEVKGITSVTEGSASEAKGFTYVTNGIDGVAKRIDEMPFCGQI